MGHENCLKLAFINETGSDRKEIIPSSIHSFANTYYSLNFNLFRKILFNPGMTTASLSLFLFPGDGFRANG